MRDLEAFPATVFGVRQGNNGRTEETSEDDGKPVSQLELCDRRRSPSLLWPNSDAKRRQLQPQLQGAATHYPCFMSDARIERRADRLGR